MERVWKAFRTLRAKLSHIRSTGPYGVLQLVPAVAHLLFHTVPGPRCRDILQREGPLRVPYEREEKNLGVSLWRELVSVRATHGHLHGLPRLPSSPPCTPPFQFTLRSLPATFQLTSSSRPAPVQLLSSSHPAPFLNLAVRSRRRTVGLFVPSFLLFWRLERTHGPRARAIVIAALGPAGR